MTAFFPDSNRSEWAVTDFQRHHVSWSVSAEANGFSCLETLAPRLRCVCFNGKASGKFERWFAEQGYETYVLPSTSPAYTLALERKTLAWTKAWKFTP